MAAENAPTVDARCGRRGASMRPRRMAAENADAVVVSDPSGNVASMRPRRMAAENSPPSDMRPSTSALLQ